jgi:Zn-dependent protease
MKWSIKVGKILGIDGYAHFTFLLLLVFLGFVTWQSAGRIDAALAGVAFIAALFGCVLLHELGHALMARKYGITTSDITLLPILPDRARELYQIPEHAEAWTAMAIGYKANAAALPDGLRERDLAPRQRKATSQFVFTGAWGQPSSLARRESAPATG